MIPLVIANALDLSYTFDIRLDARSDIQMPLELVPSRVIAPLSPDIYPFRLLMPNSAHFIVALITSILFIADASALIRNGGFEDSDTGDIVQNNGNEGEAFAWTIHGFGTTALRGDITVSEGQRALFLEAEAASQGFKTTPGETYTLLFRYTSASFIHGAGIFGYLANNANGTDGSSGGPEDLWESGRNISSAANWFRSEPQSITADDEDTYVWFLYPRGARYNMAIDDVVVYTGEPRTDGSTIATWAGPADPAYIIGATGHPDYAVHAPGQVLRYMSLDLLRDARFNAEPLNAIVLNDGEGTLYVGEQAVFHAGADVQGAIELAGLIWFGADTTPRVTGSFSQSESGIARYEVNCNRERHSYAQLAVTDDVVLNGNLELVLHPGPDGYLPSVGDYFDLISSASSITLPENLSAIDVLIDSEAALGLGMQTTPYLDRFSDQEATLHKVGSAAVSVELVDAKQVLRVTIARPIGVPEPASVFLAAIAACVFLGVRGMIR